MLEQRFGGTYFIPRARFYYNLPGDPLANHWSLWMRSDWVAAVGKKVQNHYTIPEVHEIARLIKNRISKKAPPWPDLHDGRECRKFLPESQQHVLG
jgi:putative aldouronate transport system substrate-binding protein